MLILHTCVPTPALTRSSHQRRPKLRSGSRRNYSGAKAKTLFMSAGLTGRKSAQAKQQSMTMTARISGSNFPRISRQENISLSGKIFPWKTVIPPKGSFSFSIDPQAAVTSTPVEASNAIPTLTNTPLPESTPQPAPTTAPVSTNNPCAGGLAPIAGLVFFDILRRRRKQTDP